MKNKGKGNIPRPGTLLTPKREQEYTGFFSFLRAYLRSLQRYMMTGMLVWVPLMVTVWVSWWFISNVAFGTERMIRHWATKIGDFCVGTPGLGWVSNLHYSPTMGFLFVVLIFLTTGFLTRYLAARKIITAVEGLVGMVPGINRIYVAVQQIRDVFVKRQGSVFQKVVLVEYPRKGLLVVGFVTSGEQGIVQQTVKHKMLAVFVPTTPNPTSGFLLYVPSAEVIPLDISVEDAMKMIISGGAYLPGKANSHAPKGTVPTRQSIPVKEKGHANP